MLWDQKLRPLQRAPVSISTKRCGPETRVSRICIFDDSTMSVGPISKIKLDKFVYDPGGSGAVIIQATKGAFRFVTGKQTKGLRDQNTLWDTRYSRVSWVSSWSGREQC